MNSYIWFQWKRTPTGGAGNGEAVRVCGDSPTAEQTSAGYGQTGETPEAGQPPSCTASTMAPSGQAEQARDTTAYVPAVRV